jgi:surfactin family lipopeptide synthetase A
MAFEIDEEFLLYRSKFIKQKEYWMNKFSGHWLRGGVLFDNDAKKKCKKDREESDKRAILFPSWLNGKIIKMSKENDLAVYVILLGGLKLLIYRYTGSENIIIASPIYEQLVSEDTINDIVLIHDDIRGNMTVKELLLNVRQSVLESYENQDYPFDKLIEYLFEPMQLRDKDSFYDIVCLLKNIHDHESAEKIKGKISFIFEMEGDQLKGCIQFAADIYENHDIGRISKHYVDVLKCMMVEPDQQIAAFDFLSNQEKKQLIYDFNNNKMEFSLDKTIYRLLEKHVETTPDSVALAAGDSQITYCQLNESSNQLAKVLKRKGIERDRLVGILLNRSSLMVTIILAVWKVSGAYIPIAPEEPGQRITRILKDSDADVLFTLSRLVNADWEMDKNLEGKIFYLDIHKEEIQKESRGNPDIEMDMTDLAYIIYTSGSTGIPKGAMIEHKGMMNHIYAKIYDLQLTDKSIVAENANHTFDISVWQFFAALAVRGKTIIYADEDIWNPDAFITQLIKDGVTTLEVVPSYLSVMLDTLDFGVMEFTHLNHLLVTGETLKPNLVRRWFKKYPGIKLVNAYGPTEASDDITHHIMESLPVVERIPIGKSLHNLNIYIVDGNMNLAPGGVKGEVCVSGVGVGRGYLNDMEKTSRVFMQDPFCEEKAVRLYKTGDLGHWMEDGAIEFFGRKDYQVKVRGYRIEPGEIESIILNHSGIKEAVVIDKEDEKEGIYLCAYLVPKGEMDIAEIREYLLASIPDYMVPAYFVQLEKIPLTANGKVDRKALPDPGKGAVQDYTAPRDEVEKKLINIWSKILGIEKAVIGIDTNFFEIGGQSLNAIKLGSHIYKDFNVKVSMIEIFRTQTIRELAQLIRNTRQEEYVRVKPVEKKEYYAMTSAQRRLYILQQMEGESTCYNVPSIIHMEGILEKEKFETTFKELIKRHESLRTSFFVIESALVQKISTAVPFEIEYYDLENGEAAGNREKEIIRDFERPFDLWKPPLLRVGLIKESEKKYVLITDMHHIIGDGISDAILIKDFLALYKGDELPELRLQYKDFSEWQNREMKGTAMKQQEEYWLKEFEGEIPVLNLSTDFTRPAVQSVEGNTINFWLGSKITAALKEAALEEEVTLYMALLAILNVLFSKLSGQEDIVIGTAAAGRRHPDLEKIMGIFVNTLAIRNYPEGEKTFKEFLMQLKEKALKAFHNQDYPFEALVEKLMGNIDLSRHPLFNVGFLLQNQEMVREDIPGLTLKFHEHAYMVSRFDILFIAEERGEDLFFALEYSTKLFEEETMERFIKYFKEIASCVIENKTIKLKDIKITHSLKTANTEIPQVAFRL